MEELLSIGYSQAEQNSARWAIRIVIQITISEPRIKSVQTVEQLPATHALASPQFRPAWTRQ